MSLKATLRAGTLGATATLLEMLTLLIIPHLVPSAELGAAGGEAWTRF